MLFYLDSSSHGTHDYTLVSKFEVDLTAHYVGPCFLVSARAFDKANDED